MNILVIDAWLPTPERDSASLRMFHLLDLLREFGSVTFAADDLRARYSGLRAVEQLGVRVVHHSLAEHPAENSYDAIFLSRAPVAEKYLALAKQLAPRAKIIFDTTDLHYLRMFRGAQVLNNRMLLRRALEMKRTEFALMRAADLTLVVSAVEQAMLARDCPEARVQILSNILDVQPGARSFDERAGILFIGAFPHQPNADAMQWFCVDILPRVRATLGNVKITIVGSQPPEWLQAFHAENFIVAGHVPDLAPLLHQTRLTIAPLRYGAGVKGKVLQSMSYGVPVVATPIAAEGIPAQERRDILIANDAKAFADAMHELYGDETLWQTLAQNGTRIIQEHFSRDAARDALKKLFNELSFRAVR